MVKCLACHSENIEDIILYDYKCLDCGAMHRIRSGHLCGMTHRVQVTSGFEFCPRCGFIFQEAMTDDELNDCMI